MLLILRQFSYLMQICSVFDSRYRFDVVSQRFFKGRPKKILTLPKY